MQKYAIYHNDQRIGSRIFDGYTKREIEAILRFEYGLKYARNVEIIAVNW